VCRVAGSAGQGGVMDDEQVQYSHTN